MLALYLAMRESGLRNTELAKRHRVSETVVRRMLDPKNTTKPERIQAALTELGKRTVVSRMQHSGRLREHCATRGGSLSTRSNMAQSAITGLASAGRR